MTRVSQIGNDRAFKQFNFRSLLFWLFFTWANGVIVVLVLSSRVKGVEGGRHFKGNPALGQMDGSHCLREGQQWLQRLLIFAFSHLLFSCLVCGKRYKNRPGLSYHYAHTHLASEEGDEAQDQETRSPPNHRNENHRREFPVVGPGW